MSNEHYPLQIWIDPYTQFQYELLEFFHDTRTSRNVLCDSNNMSPVTCILGFYIDGYFLLYYKALSYDFLIHDVSRFDELMNHLLLFIRNYWNPNKDELFEYLTNKTLKQLNHYIDYYSNLIDMFYTRYSDTTITSVNMVKYSHDLLIRSHELLLDFKLQIMTNNDHSVIEVIEYELYQLRLSMLNSKLRIPQIRNIEKKIYMNLYDSIIPLLLFYKCFN